MPDPTQDASAGLVSIRCRSGVACVLRLAAGGMAPGKPWEMRSRRDQREGDRRRPTCPGAQAWGCGRRLPGGRGLVHDSARERGAFRREDETGRGDEVEAAAGAKRAMRVTVERRFLAVLDKSLGNQPAE